MDADRETVMTSMSENAELIQDFQDEITVGVAKVGGGTMERAYEGSWEYWFVCPSGAYHGTDLHTGTPKRHDEVIFMMFDFAAHYGWI
jgi:hypothetical protein